MSVQLTGYDFIEPMPVGDLSEDIWKARQQGTGRMAVVKFLPPIPDSDRAATELFLQEAQRLQALPASRPGRSARCRDQVGLSVLHFGIRRGRHAAGTGGSARSAAEADALLLVQGAAAALAYVWNRAGLFHGHMEPNNILIDLQDVVRVGDLGLARLLRGVSVLQGRAPATRHRTPHYAAPEQALEIDRGRFSRRYLRPGRAAAPSDHGKGSFRREYRCGGVKPPPDRLSARSARAPSADFRRLRLAARTLDGEDPRGPAGVVGRRACGPGRGPGRRPARRRTSGARHRNRAAQRGRRACFDDIRALGYRAAAGRNARGMPPRAVRHVRSLENSGRPARKTKSRGLADPAPAGRPHEAGAAKSSSPFSLGLFVALAAAGAVGWFYVRPALAPAPAPGVPTAADAGDSAFRRLGRRTPEGVLVRDPPPEMQPRTTAVARVRREDAAPPRLERIPDPLRRPIPAASPRRRQPREPRRPGIRTSLRARAISTRRWPCSSNTSSAGKDGSCRRSNGWRSGPPSPLKRINARSPPTLWAHGMPINPTG